MRVGNVQRTNAKEFQHNGMDKQDELCGKHYCNGVVVGRDYLLLVLSANFEILHGKNI